MTNVSNHTKSISLDNQPCMAILILINLKPVEYNQGLRYYPFMSNLDRCDEICNTLLIHPVEYV